MYLKDLTHNEKQAYTKLALLLISADNEITERELNMLELQTKEMGDFEIPSFSDLEYINVPELLKETSETTYKKIYFELLLIAFSDNYDASEVDMLDKVGRAVDITPEEKSKFEACAKAISDTYFVLDRLLNVK